MSIRESWTLEFVAAAMLVLGACAMPIQAGAKEIFARHNACPADKVVATARPEIGPNTYEVTGCGKLLRYTCQHPISDGLSGKPFSVDNRGRTLHVSNPDNLAGDGAVTQDNIVTSAVICIPANTP